MNFKSALLGIHLAKQQAAQDPVAGLSSKAAVMASLSKKEKDPEAGEKRRRRVAAALGVAGGIGSVLLMKSAATGVAMAAGAPALLVAGAGLAAVMATSGAVSYFKHRSTLKATGNPVPSFRLRDLVKSMVSSKASLMAGGMTALAAVIPATLMLVVGSGVAALGAGVHEYNSKRAQDRASGIDVGRWSLGGMFSTAFKSKNAGKAFLISAALGAVISGALGMFGAAPVSVDQPVQSATGNFNAAAVPEVAATAPIAEPPMPMPEMVERPSITPDAPAVEAVAKPEVVATPAPTPTPVSGPSPVEVANTSQPAVPAITAPAPSEVIFDTTDENGVRQILYGSGIIETVTPLPPAVDVNVDDVPAPAEPPVAEANPVYTPDPVEAKPLAPAVDAAPAEQPVVETYPVHTPGPVEVTPLAPTNSSDVTNADGSRTIIHESGIRETITPIHAQAAAPTPAPAAVASPPVSALPSVGECVVSETGTDIKIDCVVDVNATVQPGSGVDFRTAADPSTFRVGLSTTSEPMNAGEFLENHAIPEAQEAYQNGSFKPQP